MKDMKAMDRRRQENLPGTLVFLTLMLVAHGMVRAQSTGKLRMLIDPGDSYEFIVDHEFRMQQREVELATGPHHFSFWAPERMVVDTTLVVEEGRTKSVVLHLPYSQVFMVYQRDLQHYQQYMKVHRLLPAVITGGAALFTVLSYVKVKKAHEQLDEDRDKYDDNGSPYRIGILKNQIIPDHKDDFKKAQTRYEVAAGVTALFACTTIYLFHRSGKLPMPQFIDSEKVRFDGLSWMPGPQGGTWAGGLTWNITR
jgi:hypothetical protein